MSRIARAVGSMSLLFLLSLAPFEVPAKADEGMWTFDNPPLAQLQEKYGFTPTPGVARPSAAVERALQRRWLGLVRQRRAAWSSRTITSRSVSCRRSRRRRRTTSPTASTRRQRPRN